MGFLLVLAAWGLMGLVAGEFLDRHKKFGTGCVWGLLLGPFGVLLAYLKGEHMDQRVERAKDRDLTELRHQEMVRAVKGEPAPVAPQTPAPATPSEIAARPPQHPRRFR